MTVKPKPRDCLKCKHRIQTLRPVKPLAKTFKDMVYVKCSYTPLLVAPNLKMRCGRFEEEPVMGRKTHRGSRGGRYYTKRKKGGGTRRVYLKKGERAPRKKRGYQ